MMYLIFKFGLSAVILVAVSEVAKRSSLWAALLASLPLTSLLAFIWMYKETQQTEPIAELSMDIFWLVIPSLVLFPVFSYLLRQNWSFSAAMALAIAAMLSIYGLSLLARHYF